ncbi:glucose-6-phosphate dehydrogenase [Metabacillus litoralis]|nr:glucose-6-phosphate dehydrogenase [Metabacillus litoralis]MCM3413148.1 glucose-6-phosphate dehydrogenase [Metabacillus litoralis]
MISKDFNVRESDANEKLRLEPLSFILFGATGDLAKRKIFPALFQLFLVNRLPQSISIIGVGRKKLSDYSFQTHVKNSVYDYSRASNIDEIKITEFLSYFSYQGLDVTECDGYNLLLETVQTREEHMGIPENRLFYLSVSPEYVQDIARNLNKSGLGSTKGWRRLIIEKPFGHNLKTAQELNNHLVHEFTEEEIYRIDHYLGKSMVQNLESYDFANSLSRELWNSKYVSNVQITAIETVGVEERAGYYDHAGAIRDMFQNHLMQLLMMTAMNLPDNVNEDVIINEKRGIIESLRPLQKFEVANNVIRAQYGPGQIFNNMVIGYKEEAGVSNTSKNDTFIAARLWIDNSTWSGVPFYIRTGKRMKEKSTKIVINFKEDLNGLEKFKENMIIPHQVIITINPEEKVSFKINMKNPLTNTTEPLTIDFSSKSENVPEAYELLLFDALKGDARFFVHWKEVELTWKWIQPVLEAFEENLVPLHLYDSGSMGPEAADSLLEEDGFKWI